MLIFIGMMYGFFLAELCVGGHIRRKGKEIAELRSVLTDLMTPGADGEREWRVAWDWDEGEHAASEPCSKAVADRTLADWRQTSGKFYLESRTKAGPWERAKVTP
jgi:hypothetical protein